MLGRKDYTAEELAHARSAVAEQLSAYRKAKGPAGFEAVYFNNMTLALDRYFVHRVRAVTGKDANALNEVELIVESLMNNDAVLQGNNVLKYVPEQSVTQLKIGDRIQLSEDQFERLSAAFFDELERKFVL
jgi:hypothetical protein